MPQRFFVIAMLPFFLFLTLFLAANPVEAATIEYGDSITIEAEETIDDDIYCFGDTVNIRGTVLGDAVIFARQANIEGTVRGSLLIFAETIMISGNSAGSVRGAANSVYFNGSTEGDLIMAADTINISGPVKRDIIAASSRLVIDAPVGKDIKAAVGELIIGSRAEIEGDVYYRSADEAVVEREAAIHGALKRTEPAEQGTLSPARNFWSFIRPILSILLVTVLIILLFPNAARGTVQTIKQRPGLSLGIGALTIFITPLVALIFLLTMIGAPLSILTVLTYAMLLYLTRIFAGYFLGFLAIDKLGKKIHPVWVALIGVLILSLLVNIPYIGWLIHLLAVIIAAGALLLHLSGRKKEQVPSA